MIFSINQTFQHILASIAQGVGGWPWTPPKFALHQKKNPLDLFNAHRWGLPTPLGTTGLERPTKENIPTSPVETIHTSHTNQTYIYTQQGVTYAQITKQKSSIPLM
jgi:hypothetical protein